MPQQRPLSKLIKADILEQDAQVGLRGVEQASSDGSRNQLENPTSFAKIYYSNLGNPFGHMTRIFPLAISPGEGIVAGNRLHPNLSNKGDKPQYNVSNSYQPSDRRRCSGSVKLEPGTQH